MIFPFLDTYIDISDTKDDKVIDTQPPLPLAIFGELVKSKKLVARASCDVGHVIVVGLRISLLNWSIFLGINPFRGLL